MKINDIIDIIEYNQNKKIISSDFGMRQRDNLFNLLYNNNIYMSNNVHDLLLSNINKLYVDEIGHLQVVFADNKPSKKVIKLLKDNINIIKNNINYINNSTIKLEV